MNARCGLLALASVLAAPALAAPAAADLSITISDGEPSIVADLYHQYVITVTNNGPDPAADIVLTNVLPLTMGHYGYNHSAPWACTSVPTVGSASVICNMGGLAAGDSAVLNVNAYVAPGTTGTVSNTASVSASSNDPDLTNNSATDTNTIVLPPVPVPTLGEWAMILMGSLLAGGAALHLHRRRQTA